jgi:hypothetical protein
VSEINTAHCIPLLQAVHVFVANIKLKYLSFPTGKILSANPAKSQETLSSGANL